MVLPLITSVNFKKSPSIFMPFKSFFKSSSVGLPLILARYSLSTCFFGCIILLAKTPSFENKSSPLVFMSNLPKATHLEFFKIGRLSKTVGLPYPDFEQISPTGL